MQGLPLKTGFDELILQIRQPPQRCKGLPGPQFDGAIQPRTFQQFFPGPVSVFCPFGNVFAFRLLPSPHIISQQVLEDNGVFSFFQPVFQGIPGAEDNFVGNFVGSVFPDAGKATDQNGFLAGVVIAADDHIFIHKLCQGILDRFSLKFGAIGFAADGSGARIGIDDLHQAQKNLSGSVFFFCVELLIQLIDARLQRPPHTLQSLVG